MLPDGKRFMPQHDPRAELAPRDIVARAIDFEMKKHGLDCVYLDISHKPAEFIREHFPDHLRALPGARHRHHPPADPGGAGRALHLRRRASSTSRAARTCRPVRRSAKPPTPACTAPTAWPAIRCSNAWCSRARRRSDILASAAAHAAALPAWDESRVTDADEEVVISHNWDELRRFMWDYVGIVRTNKRLERAPHRITPAAGRNPRVLRQLPRHARSDGVAQPGRGAPT